MYNWCIILCFCLCWNWFTSILLRNFASIFIETLICSCAEFWYQGNVGLVKGVGKYSLVIFLEKCLKNWCYFFKCLVENTSEEIWA